MKEPTFSRDWHADFDLNDPSFGDQFNEICDDLVEHCPVARSQVGEGYWVVNGHEDVQQILRDWPIFSSADGIIGVNRPADQPLFKPNEIDPPEHDQLRKAMNPYFTAKITAQHEPAIREIVNGLIDKFIDDGEVELVAQFSDPIPALAFCQAVASMPLEDMPFLQKTFHDAITGPVEDRAPNWLKGQEYMEEFMRQRKLTARQNDIVDAIAYFEFPDGQAYTHTERAGTLTQLTAGGIETTGAVISGAIHHLAVNPLQRRNLRDEPSAIPRAVEEYLRYFVAAPCLGRRVMKDTELSGTMLSRGDYVVYNLGSANRDPKIFDDPQALDIERSPNKHLTFAAGVHTCIGMHLARLNIRIAIETFLQRVPDYTVKDGFEPHFQAGITRSMTALELSFKKRK
ncbi:MAG: cytochrome P450 [Gammaproteobacteria bacterium]